MEYENTTQGNSSYAFLSNPNVQKYFVDLNFDLLRGKHITADDYYSYQLLRDYYSPELKQYYRELYELNLETATIDNTTYYYLDFQPESKGKLSSPSKYRELTKQ